MTIVRRLLARRGLTTLLVAATLLLKLLVPAGYMLGSDHGRVAVTVCSGMTSHTAMAMPGPAGAAADHGQPDKPAKPDLPCAFAGLSAAALSATDAVLLTALIAFVLALGFAPVASPVRRSASYLRPPLRGPPALA